MAGIAFLLMAGPAAAANRDLLISGDLRIDGAAIGEGAGTSVTSIGDLDDDGLDDIAIGAPGADNNGRENSGSVYVVLGRTRAELGPAGSLDLLDQAVRIDGAASEDRAGTAVSGAGDVNNDGFPDLVIGAPGFDVSVPATRTDAGAAYVVFGSEDFGALDLGALGSRGFRMDGEAAGGAAGTAVSGAPPGGSGDVNADDFDDVVIGSPNLDGPDPADNGRAYVVFGSSVTDAVDLNAVRGFKIQGAPALRRSGVSVAMLGDASGDGLADVAIGAEGPYAYLVFGRTPTTPVDLALIEQRGSNAGWALEASAGAGADGKPVAGVDDLNADGLPDILVGHPRAKSAYVVFANRPTSFFGPHLDPTVPGDWGYRVFAPDDDGGELFNFGASVAGTGDLNGDGLPEALIGAPVRDVLLGAAPLDRIDAGTSYVVYGKADSDPVEVKRSPDPRIGFAIFGAVGGEQSGAALAGAEDFDGDAIEDLLVAAPLAGRNDRLGSGSVFVVSGRGNEPLGELIDELLRNTPDTRGPADEGRDVEAAAVGSARDAEPVQAAQHQCLNDPKLNPEGYCGEFDATTDEAIAAAEERPLYPDPVSDQELPLPAYAKLVRDQWGIADSKAFFLGTGQPDEAFLALSDSTKDPLKRDGLQKIRVTVPWDALKRFTPERDKGRPLVYPVRGDNGGWLRGPNKGCPAALKPRCHLQVPRVSFHLKNFRRIYDIAYPKDGRTRYELVVSFERSAGNAKGGTSLAGYAPSPLRYRNFVRAFLEAFPKVKWYTAWNEPNHEKQPTGLTHCVSDLRDTVNDLPAFTNAVRPCAKRAGEYWFQLNKLCAIPGPPPANDDPPSARCTVLAGDFADDGSLQKWGTPTYLRLYREALHVPRVHFWAWHPYEWGSNVERAQETLRSFFSTIQTTDPEAKVWVTEGGGRMHRYLAQGLARTQAEVRADEDLRRLLDDFLQRPTQNAVTRFYLYQWIGDCADFHSFDCDPTTGKDRTPDPDKLKWDSGLIDWLTEPKTRCLYRTFQKRLDGLEPDDCVPIVVEPGP